ncbi:TetR/AcrR family transcriptional regulator [Celeribacter sp.]|uniref:TetR/AcrR family transcriptional regulator n=1 Tax=Celeribacter sp. TaxID=1890673 RepID=UPI003A8E5377
MSERLPKQMSDDAPRHVARRGRPRKFDRDEALERAMQVFWTHGYDATSMQHLTAGMSINSPSIYAAFGSKEALFREAVDRYVRQEAEVAWRALDETEGLREAVRLMLRASLDVFVANTPPRGCLVVLGAGHLDAGSDPVRGFLRDQRRHFRARIEARLARAVSVGELPDDSDLLGLSECLLAFFSGLAIEAVDGADLDALYRSVEMFCTGMLPLN